MVAIIKALEAAQNQASLADISNLRAGQQVKLKHVALGNMEGLLQRCVVKTFRCLARNFG